LDLARWQFAVTTLYHFLFVPLTLGLSVLVAGWQTAWVRTGNDRYLRATKFWGKLFLINFAMGVVTGLVQEFQFGMNWSEYSRFVGDVFGPPLAIEGIVAFFLESTFLGVWIFGWDRLPKRLHLASIWLASVGGILSAYFILSANSWMQHPVGYRFNPQTGRAELADLGAVLFNSTNLAAFPHTVAGAFLVSGAFVLCVSAWHLKRGNEPGVFRSSLRLGLWVLAVAGAAVAISGDVQGRLMTEQQPMKMAAAEALYETRQPASFSLLSIGPLDGSAETFGLRVPHALSLLSTGDPNGEVEGINDLQRQYEQRYGPGDYRPYVPATYWSFRLMIGLGMVSVLLSVLGLWLTRRGRTPTGKAFWRAAIWSAPLPLVGNLFGWIFTEMGRQPWTVFGLFHTHDSVSPNVGAANVLISLAVFTLLYGALAVVEGWLLMRYAKAGPPQLPAEDQHPSEDRLLAFAY
jgi:cytochrome d ubiquinol oxidase subunit I